MLTSERPSQSGLTSVNQEFLPLTPKGAKMDVIIIGSGPAGCSAASTCLKAGLEVVIVADHSEVADLGTSDEGGLTSVSHAQSTLNILESIHPGVSSLLEKIGAPGVEVAATRGQYTGIQVGNTFTPLGEDASGPWKGMHIDRQVFDAQLLHRIHEAGVEVRFNEEVEDFLLKDERVIGLRTSYLEAFDGRRTLKRRNGNLLTELHAKYVIDASGKNAIAGRKLKFKRRFFSPPFICWTGISQCLKPLSIDTHAAHFIPRKNGWTWLAPLPPDHCAWTRLSAKGEKSFLPPEELKDCTTNGKIKAANMRWRLYRPACKEGIVLCGDAAGILDPAAGQGIFNALWSGMVAAQAVVSCLQQPEMEAFHLARYDGWFVTQYEEKVGKLRSYYEDHGIAIG